MGTLLYTQAFNAGTFLVKTYGKILDYEAVYGEGLFLWDMVFSGVENLHVMEGSRGLSLISINFKAVDSSLQNGQF